MEHRDEALTTDVEHALEGLLAQWTQARRLSESKSEAIHRNLIQSVQATQTELPYAWWRRLFQQCTSPMPQPSATFLSALQFATAGTEIR
ncbi:MAG: hypothetical protein JWL77_1602 [Chthonomonadaceae bacterium]|nr:hypothetical protein [Chthonomonadaceae bacterium]